MAEYIERQKVIDITAETGALETQRRIKELPASDVAPVVHAKWEHTHTSESYFNECWRCSACGFDDTEGFVFDFCPHCGAKMDLEESK